MAKIEDILKGADLSKQIGKRISFADPSGTGFEVFKIGAGGTFKSLFKTTTGKGVPSEFLTGEDFTLGVFNPGISREQFAFTPRDFQGATAEQFTNIAQQFRPEAFRKEAVAPLDIGFRPRRADENLTSYLQEKKAAELAATGKTNIGKITPDFQATATRDTNRFDTQGNFITESGQKINPKDPSFATYLKQAGVTAPTAPPTGQQPPPGATQAPTQYQYGTEVLGKKANDAAVNALYQSYFGRDASAAEVKNWGTQGGADTTVKALEDFLKSERDKYSFTEPVKPLGQVAQEFQEKAEITPIDAITEAGDMAGADISVTMADPLPQYEAQIGSLTEQIATLKTDLENSFKTKEADFQTQIDNANKEIKKLQDEQKAVIEKGDPAQSQFYDQQTTILQNQLDAAEIASTKLKEDYEKSRALTAELEVLNSEANADIQAMKGVTGLAAIRTPRINQRIDQWTGRASILQAALAGVQNNISLSYQYIDKAQEDITARRNEEISYYNALISFYGGLEATEKGKLTTAQTNQKEQAQNLIDMKQSEIDNLEAVSNMIKTEMIENPARIAGAGINLATDNLETITQKLAEYDRTQIKVAEQKAKDATEAAIKADWVATYSDIPLRLDMSMAEMQAMLPQSRIYQQGTRLAGGGGGGTDLGKLLSVSEAKALGVPYGTTKGEAINMGLTPTSPLDPDFEGAARVVIALENADASTNEAYNGIVSGLSEDLGLPTETVDKMLIAKINELKGILPTTPTEPIEENIASDFDIESLSPKTIAELKGEEEPIIKEKLTFEDVFGNKIANK